MVVKKEELETSVLQEPNFQKELARNRGPKTTELLENLPAITGEIIKQMIDNTDVRIRERLRAEIKAILAFALADTQYPIQHENTEKGTKRRDYDTEDNADMI